MDFINFVAKFLSFVCSVSYCDLLNTMQ